MSVEKIKFDFDSNELEGAYITWCTESGGL